MPPGTGLGAPRRKRRPAKPTQPRPVGSSTPKAFLNPFKLKRAIERKLRRVLQLRRAPGRAAA
jgi:hypothetical protein